MTNVITFPNAASSADVICTPLSITFPRIYRAAMRDQVHYTLSPDRSPYPDLVELKQVRSIVAGDRCSVVVRRHQSFDMAHAYLIGLEDGNESERYDTICQTDQGYFTLLERATKPSWPSPMIFYVVRRFSKVAVGNDRYPLTADGMRPECLTPTSRNEGQSARTAKSWRYTPPFRWPNS